MSDQHFYENQSKKMGSRENIENLISNLKSTQKITKKALDSPMHYFHFLFNIGKLHCALGVSYVKFCLVFENLLPVCGTGSVTEIWDASYFSYGEKS